MFETAAASQNRNTARLVISTFRRLHHQDGVTPAEITRFLRYQFGALWKNELTQKAEQTLKQCMNLGFLERKGNRYTMAKPGKRLISTLDAREGCGLGSTQKTRRARRSESRRRRRAPPPPRRRTIRRRRTCVQGRVKKRRYVRTDKLPKSTKDEESEHLELMDDDDDGSQESASD